MQKTMIKFLMWFLIAMITLPAMILTMPIKAQAATKNAVEKIAPVTKLSTKPDEPNENGWFNQVTMIKLKPDTDGKTYFQWNSTEGLWQEFEQTMRAWRGSNTLYYYSENGDGTKEAIQSQVFRVEYGHPKSPAVQLSSAESQVSISWEKQTDIASYRIAKDGDDLDRVPSEPPLYLDQNVKVDETYSYKLKAVSQAGLKSKAIKTSVKVSANVAPKEIQPAIGQGASIEVAQKAASVQSAKVEPKEETPTTTNPEPAPIKNWNRLFIALSILIIAAGAAIAGYYGYEWWMNRREGEEVKDKKTNSRW